MTRTYLQAAAAMGLLWAASAACFHLARRLHTTTPKGDS